MATDADIANVFKQGSTVPHHLRVYACDGTDVTTAVASQVMLRLTETFRSSAAAPATVIVPEYIGQGDAGGVLPLVGSHFKYNLSRHADLWFSGNTLEACAQH